MFEYDEAKNQKNSRKHHISIPELATIFEKPFTSPVMDIPDVSIHSEKNDTGHSAGLQQAGM